MVKRIVIATDGSPGAWAAVAGGVALAHDLGASVTFVSVRPGAPLFGERELIRHLCDELRETRAALDGAMAEAERLGVDADFEICEGPVAEEIVRAACYRHAGAIVVGARSAELTAGMPLGSVAQELVEASPLPVVIVNRPGPAHEPRQHGTERAWRVRPAGSRASVVPTETTSVPVADARPAGAPVE